MTQVNVVPWNEMTAEQREWVVYFYASCFMTQVLKWPSTPPDVDERIRQLDEKGIWDAYKGESS